MELTNRDFEKILQLGIDLTTTMNRDKLLESIVDNGMEITKCDGGTLYLYEDGVLKFRIMRILLKNYVGWIKMLLVELLGKDFIIY